MKFQIEIPVFPAAMGLAERNSCIWESGEQLIFLNGGKRDFSRINPYVVA